MSYLTKRIFEFRTKNQIGGKAFTVKHFMEEGIARSTIYKTLQRLERNIGPEQRRGQGRKTVKMPTDRVRLLKGHFDHHAGRSTRKAARKYGISQTYIRKLLRTKTAIKCRKKQKIPARTEAQADEAKIRCGVLTKNISIRNGYLTMSLTSPCRTAQSTEMITTTARTLPRLQQPSSSKKSQNSSRNCSFGAPCPVLAFPMSSLALQASPSIRRSTRPSVCNAA